MTRNPNPDPGTDPYVHAEPDGDTEHLLVGLASGRVLRFSCTVPLDGVLRLRASDPPPDRRPAPGRSPRRPPR
ncbi:hypothetical protein, partial [Streptomyces calidiresistens]